MTLVPHERSKWTPTPTKIYLAGKISHGDWRPNSNRVSVAGQPWVPVDWQGIQITGPFFTSCDHGCAHGSRTHAVMACDGDPAWQQARQFAFKECLTAIYQSDVYFCWLDLDTEEYCTAYGTLVELGFAVAMQKRIIIGAPELPGRVEYTDTTRVKFTSTDDLWFAFACAHQTMIVSTPEQALKLLVDQESTHPDLESPLEEMFWKAVNRRKPPELEGIKVQWKVQVEGHNYRLDFALPDLMIAFEMDGFTHHSERPNWVYDRERQLRLELAGWRIGRFSWDHAQRDIDECVDMAVRLVRQGRLHEVYD